MSQYPPSFPTNPSEKLPALNVKLWGNIWRKFGWSNKWPRFRTDVFASPPKQINVPARSQSIALALSSAPLPRYVEKLTPLPVLSCVIKSIVFTSRSRLISTRLHLLEKSIEFVSPYRGLPASSIQIPRARPSLFPPTYVQYSNFEPSLFNRATKSIAPPEYVGFHTPEVFGIFGDISPACDKNWTADKILSQHHWSIRRITTDIRRKE